ncbi:MULTISPECIES: shikimate dehydrogenase family protein [unclassified Rhizobium]|uniref:shikimate dehydrogenase family protein n=1 Tax=unclassified Rhizobium TaxID=2613769 RepID=UPI001AD9A864|nr:MULTISPECIES: ThiF family adenylyltransferase [unclassified Rhizobium]MBO9126703.1 ThiF family adenylyltransferase [Rhizobium sp. 16-488-2b]MBO9177150.1 ThiF family adenylyltransferase [Rhizobium sp. 16-488-2a]
MISGTTRIIAHLGYPTETFKSPLIYNPYFEKHGIDAVVVPMGCRAEDFPDFLRLVFRLSNIHGALITMPHKVTTMGLLDELSTRAQVAGACNAIRLDERGRLIGDMFDGEGFVRGVLRKGRRVAGADVLVVGSGGVGSAIAASLAAAGVRRIAIFDANTAVMDGLMGRLRQHYPDVDVTAGSRDPEGFDIVVNATPLGMKSDDPLPIDVSRLSPSTFVGEVVMKQEITPFLEAARARGCDFQVGTDMLFEQIPAYLEFFGFPTTTADDLRSVARIG